MQPKGIYNNFMYNSNGFEIWTAFRQLRFVPKLELYPLNFGA